MGLVGELLERAARATPPVAADRGTGWWLRHTDNGTWWSGAVLAHGAAGGLAGRVDAAERFYAGHGAVARFQVCVDCPAGLDRVLADRGYRREAPVALLTAVGGGPWAVPPTGTTVRVDTAPGPDWLAVLSATGEPGTDARHEARLLHRVDRPQAFLTVLTGGEPVGIGRAVADDGWTGVFTMATAVRARRRGVARLVLGGIGSWAAAHDAPRLYLQVELSNGPALRLYESAGFSVLTTYHYRVAAVAQS